MIIAAKKRGESTESIIKWVTKVSKSSIDKIWSLFNKTGSFEPKPYIGNNRKITLEHDQQIRAKIKENNDITLLEMIDELCLNVSESGLSRHLEKMGLSYKKRHCTQMDKNVKT
jgi:transposase